MFTSVVCYCHWYRRKHGKCSLCNESWHCWLHKSKEKQKHKCANWILSEINEELLRIHLYIIWHYYIISHIKLWFLKMTSSHKYALKYRQWSKVFGHFRIFLYISYKTSYLIYYLEVNSCPISIIMLSTKAERYVVYSINFEITFEACIFQIAMI